MSSAQMKAQDPHLNNMLLSPKMSLLIPQCKGLWMLMQQLIDKPLKDMREEDVKWLEAQPIELLKLAYDYLHSQLQLDGLLTDSALSPYHLNPALAFRRNAFREIAWDNFAKDVGRYVEDLALEERNAEGLARPMEMGEVAGALLELITMRDTLAYQPPILFRGTATG